MDGILIVDKPKGWTSHDVVDFIRKKFSLKKVGHAGTLDPMATGVLVVLIGSFTKSSSLFIADDKVYEGTLILGAESDTGDAWGKISASKDNINFSRSDIENVFNEFLGETQQRPPAYSAVKIKGRKLYELARRGIEVTAEPRTIRIKKIEVLEVKLPEVSFRLTCSKGTYVRQLAVDIGKKLGCGAYLSRLVRTRSGKFDIDGSSNVDTIKQMNDSDLSRALTIC